MAGIKILATIPHFAAWIKQAFCNASGWGKNATWPLWKPEFVFPAKPATQCYPARHQGVIPWGQAGVTELIGWGEWHATFGQPFPVGHRVCVTAPTPAAADAGWIIERAYYVGVPSGINAVFTGAGATLAPAPAMVAAFADAQNPLMHLRASAPEFAAVTQYDDLTGYSKDFYVGAGDGMSGNLLLVKGGTSGLTTRRQSTQCSYLVRVNSCKLVPTETWAWSGAWSYTSPGACMAYSIGGGHLYALVVDPETGALTEAISVPECQFQSIYTEIQFDETCMVWDMTWPYGVRAFRVFVPPDQSFGGGYYNHYRAVILWRPVEAWRFASDKDSGGTWPALGSYGWVRGPFAPVGNETAQDARDAVRNEAATGGWRILGVAGPSGTDEGTTVTLVDPPAAGQEAILSGGIQITSDYGGGPFTTCDGRLNASFWPEAQALPFAFSVLGGGAMVGGTS